MIENWIKWQPHALLNNQYFIKSIKHDNNDLRILLKCNNPTNKKIQIIFDGPIESYRYCDEHCRLNLLEKLNNKYGSKFYLNWRLFKIKNSEYLEWLNKESLSIVNHLKTKHFVLIDNDCILDIVVSFEPNIKII